MLLELRDLSVCYGRIQAVRGANLRLEAGEIVAVLGANGAGKSSMLGAAAGLLPVEGGRILYEGRDVAGWGACRMVRSGACLVPEGRSVVGDMSVEENLLLGTVSRRQRDNLDGIYRLLPMLKERRGQQAGVLTGGGKGGPGPRAAAGGEPKTAVF